MKNARLATLCLTLGWAAVPVAAQTAGRSDEGITVVGNKRSLPQLIEDTVAESRHGQIARFEKKICPMVIGLPDGLSEKVTRMVRANIAALGGKVGDAPCDLNALALFVDRPRDLLIGLNAKEPSFFQMTPRAFDNFVREPKPHYSWTITDTFGPRGEILKRMTSLTYFVGKMPVTVPISGESAVVVKHGNASKLTTTVRQELELSMLAIDLDNSEGKTLRQLADFIAMNFMVETRPDAGAKDMTSILSLYEPRPEGVPIPASMSNLDRGIVRGFYDQRHNNRTAIQQRENIASAIRRNAAKTR